MVLKNKGIRVGILAVLLCVCGAWKPHEFYVSLTDIRYNSHNERFEVSMRLFPDDLDRALFERWGIRTQLATELEHERADSLLMVYLLDGFSLVADKQEIVFSYLGKEAESDAIWCYLESDPHPYPAEVSIGNKLLIEVFPDQINIIQVYVNDWNKGLLLNRNQSSGDLQVGK
jgi:hypothetical protein